ncbi:MAG: nucleoside-diphosphate-sugar epimerase [Kiritimatiellia bacterium]|jgi:nucleoside-diphosphate-sugar epimerase
MKKILLTGGAGFIGTHIAERLVEDHELVLFDNYRRDSLSGLPLAEHKNVTVLKGDVLRTDEVTAALQGVDRVIHLAAIAGVSSYYSMPLKVLQVNILGTVNLLEAAVKAGVKQFISFSTSEVYGSEARNVTEQDPHGIGPTSDKRWTYATSKLASENFVLRFGEEYGFHASCLRPFNVYGPRQTGEGAISNFCTAALKGEPLKVYGDGKAIRAWCYVSDMVDAVMLAMEKEAAAGQSFNIGNADTAVNTIELAEQVAALVPGATTEYESIDRAEVAVRVPNVDKARTLLGFEPKVGLVEGLQHTLDWYRSSL